MDRAIERMIEQMEQSIQFQNDRQNDGVVEVQIDRMIDRYTDRQIDRQMSLWRENYIDAVPKFKSVTQPGDIKSIQKYISTTVMTYRQPSLKKIQIYI